MGSRGGGGEAGGVDGEEGREREGGGEEKQEGKGHRRGRRGETERGGGAWSREEKREGGGEEKQRGGEEGEHGEKKRRGEGGREGNHACSAELKIITCMQSIYQQMSGQQSPHQYRWTSQPHSCRRRETGRAWSRPPPSGRRGRGQPECGSGWKLHWI